jgi:hypothetical protein
MISLLEEHREIHDTIAEISGIFPEFIVGGSFVLQRFLSLNRRVNDIDIVVPKCDKPKIKVLRYPEFVCCVHEPYWFGKLKVDVMSVDPYWKITSYRDTYWNCRIQTVYQVIEIIRLALKNDLTSSRNKRISDLEYIDNITKW